MLDPEGLFEMVPGAPRPQGPREGPPGVVLVHAMPGFVDAGSAVRLATTHLLATAEHELVARFDVDQLVDYRDRRPTMIFDIDHYERYSPPELALHRLRDRAGSDFLLLTGPEPDLQWERFVAAVLLLVDRLDVRLGVGLLSIPMGVPHTRPIGVTMTATRPELVTVRNPWRGEMRVPAGVDSLIQLRLGAHQRDGIGFAAHVPHYLSQVEYPEAAAVLLRRLGESAGLLISDDELRAAAQATARTMQEQVDSSEEVAGVVRALERQYDEFQAAADRDLLSGSDRLPSGDELGAQFERFLANLDDPDQRP